MANPWEQEYSTSEENPWDQPYQSTSGEGDVSDKSADDLINMGYKVYDTPKGVMVFAYDPDGLASYLPIDRVTSAVDQYKPNWNKPKPGRDAARNYNRHLTKTIADERKALEGLLDQNYQLNREMVSKQGAFENTMIHAGQQSDKFIQGGKDLIDLAMVIPRGAADLVTGAASTLFGDGSGGTRYADVSFQNIADRNMQEAEKDQLFRAMNTETNGSKLGGAIPFFALDPVLSGPAKMASGAVRKVLNKATGEIVEQTAGRAGKAFDKLRASGNPLINKIGVQTVDPFRRRMVQRAATPKFENPLGVTKVDQLLHSMALGGMEGALHHDMSSLEGSALGGLSYIASAPLRRLADKSPDLWNDPGLRELIEWGKDRGYKMTPGMETGSRVQQRFDNALRGQHGMSDVMSRIDSNNRRVVNETAWKAAGIDGLRPGESMGEAILRHRDDLKKTYQGLESTSSGFLTIQKRNEISDLLRQYDGTDVKSTQIRESLRPYIDDLLGSDLPMRDVVTGRMLPQRFDGGKYQTIRSRIQAAKSEAFANSDTGLGGALSALQRKFDDALEEGMRRRGADGAATVAAWKDANQKYAITNALVDKGSDVFGNFNPQKYENHLMGTDAMRTVTGQGPAAVQDLQKLVKLSNLERESAPALLSTPGIKNIDPTGKTSLGMKALETVRAKPLLPGQELLTRLYLEGIAGFHPSVKGFLNTATTKEGQLWDLDRMIRAGTMNANPAESIGDYVREKVTGETEQDRRDKFLDYLLKNGASQ